MEKKEFTFKDLNGHRVSGELEIKDGSFNMSGEFKGSMGQCFDDVVPKNKHQQKLINIWKKYHLKGVNAGTINQSKVLEKLDTGKSYSYNDSIFFLKLHNINGDELSALAHDNFTRALKKFYKDRSYLATVRNYIIKQLDNGWTQEAKYKVNIDKHKVTIEILNKLFNNSDIKIRQHNADSNFLCICPATIHPSINYKKTKKYMLKQLDNITDLIEYTDDLFLSAYVVKINNIPYIYGSDWLKRDLPKDFENNLNELLKNIETEEKTLKEEESIDLNMLHNDSEITDKVYAICKYFDVVPDDVEEQYGNIYAVEGIDYLVVTYNEGSAEMRTCTKNIIDEIGLDGLNLDSPSVYIESEYGDSVKITYNIDFNRGESLNFYNGNEEEINILDETFYFYRQ